MPAIIIVGVLIELSQRELWEYVYDHQVATSIGSAKLSENGMTTRRSDKTQEYIFSLHSSNIVVFRPREGKKESYNICLSEKNICKYQKLVEQSLKSQ